MSLEKDDGQNSLRRQIVSALLAAGLAPLRAGKQATSELLRLRRAGAGEHEVHAGNDVFIVTVKDE